MKQAQMSIVVGANSIRVGPKVYRLDRSFPSDESAGRYHDQLEKILSGEQLIAETHTPARGVDEEPNFKLPVVQDLVIEDLNVRRRQGIAKYKVPLQPGDGSHTSIEKYLELLDLLVYFRQELYENYGR